MFSLSLSVSVSHSLCVSVCVCLSLSLSVSVSLCVSVSLSLWLPTFGRSREESVLLLCLWFELETIKVAERNDLRRHNDAFVLTSFWST